MVRQMLLLYLHHLQKKLKPKKKKEKLNPFTPNVLHVSCSGCSTLHRQNHQKWPERA